MAILELKSLEHKNKIFHSVLDFFEAHKPDLEEEANDPNNTYVNKPGRLICNTDVGDCEEYICHHPTCEAHSKIVELNTFNHVDIRAILSDDSKYLNVIGNFLHENHEVNKKHNNMFIEAWKPLFNNHDLKFSVYTVNLISSDTFTEFPNIDFIELDMKREDFFMKVPYSEYDLPILKDIGYKSV